VRYETSGSLIEVLNQARAVKRLTPKVRQYCLYELLIIDEFGFEKLERKEVPDALSLFYKVIDGRNRRSSTAIITNVNFDDWTEYLGDPPLTMALLDRVVDQANLIPFEGESIRKLMKRQMRIDYRELKSRICLQELLERIGWKSDKGRGDQLRSPCPLPACQSKASSAGSNRKDRSFSIHASKNIYRCFRCGSAGNALDFWQAYRATTLYEAAKELIQNHETSNCTPRSSQPAKQQSPISHAAKLTGS